MMEDPTSVEAVGEGPGALGASNMTKDSLIRIFEYIHNLLGRGCGAPSNVSRSEVETALIQR